MSQLRKRAAYLLAALVLVLSMAGVLAAASAQPARASSLGACNILIEGQYRWQYNRLYQCRHIRGIGYLWVYVGTYYGCTSARLTRAC